MNIISTLKDIYSNSNPNEYRNLIEKHFIPTQQEKKENAEISTPKLLVDDMLNKIPIEYWTDINTTFEPCCGKGNFVIAIFDKFFDGLKDKYPNKVERCQIIKDKILYFADISELNIFITKSILNFHIENKCGKRLDDKYNTYTGDTLKINIEDIFGLTGFNSVIGNPPYNGTLYVKFINKLIIITKILLFVIPSTFTINITGKKLVNILKINGLKNIYFLDKKVWNNSIDIDTLYFLCIKDYKDKILINDIEIDRKKDIRNINSNVYNNLLDKINKYEKLELYKGKNDTLDFKKKFIETDNIKFNKTKEYKYKLLSRLNGGNEEVYYMKKYKEEKIIGIKLLFPRGTASYNKISNLLKLDKDIVYSKIEKEDIYLSKGLVYFKCNNIKEVEFLKWYLNRSKLIRFLFIKENKFSELTKGFINILPKISSIINQNDKDVYKYFNLSKEEINLIENTFLSSKFIDKEKDNIEKKYTFKQLHNNKIITHKNLNKEEFVELIKKYT